MVNEQSREVKVKAMTMKSLVKSFVITSPKLDYTMALAPIQALLDANGLHSKTKSIKATFYAMHDEVWGKDKTLLPKHMKNTIIVTPDGPSKSSQKEKAQVSSKDKKVEPKHSADNNEEEKHGDIEIIDISK